MGLGGQTDFSVILTVPIYYTHHKELLLHKKQGAADWYPIGFKIVDLCGIIPLENLWNF